MDLEGLDLAPHIWHQELRTITHSELRRAEISLWVFFRRTVVSQRLNPSFVSPETESKATYTNRHKENKQKKKRGEGREPSHGASRSRSPERRQWSLKLGLVFGGCEREASVVWKLSFLFVLFWLTIKWGKYLFWQVTNIYVGQQIQFILENKDMF